ncbi:hypothetical protein SCHPADRAFT_901338 [Schizopora paradoxa]|uniref:RING-type domain-containing protein n=1 Tax=Schizopora paradoxa TaxID=27342 RepID=A0A0H2SHY2_9AGAM|nr:hypothetical protein SCHPADRAFT_901338 [Schizopora paradoxa]
MSHHYKNYDSPNDGITCTIDKCRCKSRFRIRALPSNRPQEPPCEPEYHVGPPDYVGSNVLYYYGPQYSAYAERPVGEPSTSNLPLTASTSHPPNALGPPGIPCAKCPLCKRLVTDMSTGPCGHKVCTKCFKKALRKIRCCPMCHRATCYDELIRSFP